jgi:hypothetical protein
MAALWSRRCASCPSGWPAAAQAGCRRGGRHALGKKVEFFQYFQKMLNIFENVGENLFSKYWIQHFVYWCNSF